VRASIEAARERAAETRRTWHDGTILSDFVWESWVSWAFRVDFSVFLTFQLVHFGFAFLLQVWYLRWMDGERGRAKVEQLGLIGLFGVLIWTRLLF